MHKTVFKYNCLHFIRAICQMSSSLRYVVSRYRFTLTPFPAFCVLRGMIREPIPYKGCYSRACLL